MDQNSDEEDYFHLEEKEVENQTLFDKFCGVVFDKLQMWRNETKYSTQAHSDKSLPICKKLINEDIKNREFSFSS